MRLLGPSSKRLAWVAATEKAKELGWIAWEQGILGRDQGMAGSNSSISVGKSVAVDQKIFSEMYRKAGDALGEAKSKGRNRFSLYEAAA
jgi:GGDEF domain-containing protein